MRYLSSVSFVVGLLLIGAAFAITPLFMNGTVVVTGNPATDSSWDIHAPTRWDFRAPMLMAVSGMVLMVIATVRVHRARNRTEKR
jgi:hypothetical protein